MGGGEPREARGGGEGGRDPRARRAETLGRRGGEGSDDTIGGEAGSEPASRETARRRRREQRYLASRDARSSFSGIGLGELDISTEVLNCP